MKRKDQIRIKINEIDEKRTNLLLEYEKLLELECFCKFDDLVDEITKETKPGCFEVYRLSFNDFNELKDLILDQQDQDINNELYKDLLPNGTRILYKNVIFILTLDPSITDIKNN